MCDRCDEVGMHLVLLRVNIAMSIYHDARPLTLGVVPAEYLWYFCAF